MKMRVSKGVSSIISERIFVNPLPFNAKNSLTDHKITFLTFPTGSSPNYYFKNSIETFKMTSCGQEKHSKSKFRIFQFQCNTKLPIETYFILILETRITRLEG